MMRSGQVILSAVVGLILVTHVAEAQHCPAMDPSQKATPTAAPGTREDWLTNLVPPPNSPESKAYAKLQRTRAEQEKDLKKIRAQYFRSTKNTEARQVGISKIRQFTDPAIFPVLVDLFQGEGEDAENAVLDHFQDLKTDEADATLAWAAVFGKEKPFRESATKRLLKRTKDAGEVSNRIKWVVSLGLRDNATNNVVSASQLADSLSLFDAIPMLINAQVTGTAGGSRADDGGDAALAYILIGTQRAFVAQLTPVVGDSAVAFNPQLGVLTEGTYIRVIDAVVITYRVEVNAALIALSTRAWGGQSTASLGWDQVAWRKWYANEYVPYRRKIDEQAAASTAKP